MQKQYSYHHRPCDVFPAGVFELEMNYTRTSAERMQILKTEDVFNFCKQIKYYERVQYQEFFYVIMCDRGNRAYSYKLISLGGSAGTVVDVKMIYQSAIMSHASGLVLLHNHPSGNTTPSDHDKKITRQIIDAGKLLDIRVLDHVIVTKDEWFSFCDEGLL